MENKEKSKMITGQSSGSGSQRGGALAVLTKRMKNIISGGKEKTNVKY